jgi:hypothetical protein
VKASPTIRVTVRCVSGPLEVTGYEVTSLRGPTGWAVTPAVDFVEDALVAADAKPEDEAWVPTHIASGRCASNDGDGWTLADAHALALLLADASGPIAADGRLTPEQKKRGREVIRAFQGRGT